MSNKKEAAAFTHENRLIINDHKKFTNKMPITLKIKDITENRNANVELCIALNCHCINCYKHLHHQIKGED